MDKWNSIFNVQISDYALILLWFVPSHFSNNTLKAGGRLNKKDGLTRYGNSHVKDKTS